MLATLPSKLSLMKGCDLVKQRFPNGPARPYTDKSISKLLQIMDESYIGARKANPEAGEHMSILGIEDMPMSVLKPPATEDDITALERRLSSEASPDDEDENPILPDKHLPHDYKEFLRTSNGFEERPGDQTGIFCCIEEVGKGEITW